MRARGMVVSVPGQFGRPGVFWLGVTMITLGVLINFADFLQKRATTGGLHGQTPVDFIGVTIDIVGFFVATYGLLPLDWQDRFRPGPGARPLPTAVLEAPTGPSSVGLASLDSTRLTGTHWRMIGRLFVGAALDTMKPAILGFVLPGLRTEYHLTPAQGSIFPLFALTGLTLGSVLFGRLGDSIGRRASFVLTALLLAATALCGFMLGLEYQLVTCFLMGLAAGGELPIIYTLLAETMPTRHRGWLSVAIGGVGGLAGYFAASSVSYLFEPTFTWRILWFSNLPTALFMLLLIKWVPESPRYLIQRGYVDEARKVMASVGVPFKALAAQMLGNGPSESHRVRDLFQGKLLGTTVMLSLYGVAWGLCNWGFITWLPTMLRNIGLQPTAVSGLLATSALIAAPGTLAAAALYGFWSSKRSATLFAIVSAAVLLLLAFGQNVVAAQPGLLSLGIVALLIGTSSMIGVLAPYSVELFPTALRGVGSGVVTGASKAGGLVGPPLVGAILTIAPGFLGPGLVVGVPIGMAGLLMAWRGKETRGRRLEELVVSAPSS